MQAIEVYRMTQVEILSQSDPTDFTEVWYDLADDDHFWMRWRFNFFLREIRRLGLDPTSPLTGLDIGCGPGAIERQLASNTAWRADGCDLNRAALALHSGDAGRVLYYNTHDRRSELHEKYDFLMMFDVIEHIENTKLFIEAAIYHLKPGGYVFVNVPALPPFYSNYDTAAGHCRRYDKRTLRQHLVEAGLTLSSMRYWGASLLPALIARKIYVARKTSSDDIIRAGFHPPNRIMSFVLSAVLACEAFLPQAPIGTSLLAIARKPG